MARALPRRGFAELARCREGHRESCGGEVQAGGLNQRELDGARTPLSRSLHSDHFALASPVRRVLHLHPAAHVRAVQRGGWPPSASGLAWRQQEAPESGSHPGRKPAASGSKLGRISRAPRALSRRSPFVLVSRKGSRGAQMHLMRPKAALARLPQSAPDPWRLRSAAR